MIDALYCRSTAVLLAMHVWLYVVAVLYMVSGAGRPRGDTTQRCWHDAAITGAVSSLPRSMAARAEAGYEVERRRLLLLLLRRLLCL